MLMGLLSDGPWVTIHSPCGVRAKEGQPTTIFPPHRDASSGQDIFHAASYIYFGHCHNITANVCIARSYCWGLPAASAAPSSPRSMCEDVLPTEDGLVVKLRRSKTDPEGKGRDVGIPYGSTPSTCPVRALTAWKTAAGICEGALFRGVDRHGRVGTVRLHKDSVGLVVKRAAEAAGLDPAKYAGHSLRAGLATQAYLNGAGELAIMRQTGHRSLAMVRRYIRDGSLFRENPAAKLGLVIRHNHPQKPCRPGLRIGGTSSG